MQISKAGVSRCGFETKEPGSGASLSTGNRRPCRPACAAPPSAPRSCGLALGAGGARSRKGSEDFTVQGTKGTGEGGNPGSLPGGSEFLGWEARNPLRTQVGAEAPRLPRPPMGNAGPEEGTACARSWWHRVLCPCLSQPRGFCRGTDRGEGAPRAAELGRPPEGPLATPLQPRFPAVRGARGVL